jgi:hypothetical protein
LSRGHKRAIFKLLFLTIYDGIITEYSLLAAPSVILPELLKINLGLFFGDC